MTSTRTTDSPQVQPLESYLDGIRKWDIDHIAKFLPVLLIPSPSVSLSTDRGKLHFASRLTPSAVGLHSRSHEPNIVILLLAHVELVPSIVRLFAACITTSHRISTFSRGNTPAFCPLRCSVLNGTTHSIKPLVDSWGGSNSTVTCCCRFAVTTVKPTALSTLE